MSSTIKQVRALVVRGGGGDYHDQAGGHWIDNHIASSLSRYPEYRQSRQSFGINVLGTLVVEIEASDGTVGFAVTTGGEPVAYIVEKHLARFLEGRDPKKLRTHLGPDVLRHPVLRPQGTGTQRDFGRRSCALGPPRQDPRRAHLSSAGRPGSQRAAILRDRFAPRSGKEAGFHRWQTAASSRPRRGRSRI